MQRFRPGSPPVRGAWVEIKMLKAMRRGEVHRLVIGPKAYGTNKWVITKLSNSLNRYDNRGNLLVAKVSVTMKSYSGR